MKRIITDELFNKLISLLLQDEKVQLFQQLLMAEKSEENEIKKGEE